jgi:hypothetical protein
VPILLAEPIRSAAAILLAESICLAEPIRMT